MALTDPIYEAIEIAFKTSGAQGITALQAEIAKLKATVGNYDAQLKAGTITHATFIANTKDEIESIARLKEIMAAGQRVMDGHSAKLKDTSSAARGATQSMLELSRGIEDFAVSGPIGALNNIPGIFQGIGRSIGLTTPMVAGLTTGVSIFATTAYVAYKNWDAIEKALGLGLPVKPLEDVKALEAALKDLTDKKWKTSIDFQDIENLEARVEEVKRAQAGLKKLSGDDEATKKRASMVTDALVEGSGGGDAGRRKFIDAAVAAAMGPVQPEVAKFNADLAAIDAKIAEATKAGDGNLVLGLMKSKEVIQNTDRAKVAQADANRREAVGRQVGSAMMGDEAQRRWLSDLVAGHEDKFAAQGFDTLRIRGGLEAAAPDTLFAEERAKIAQANDVKAKAAQEKRDAEKAKVAAEADQDETTNNDARRREDKAARDERARAIADEARRHAPGMEQELTAAYLRRVARGQLPQQAGNALAPQVTRRLGDLGVPVLNRDEIAGHILQGVADKAGNRVHERIGQEGGNLRSGADSVLGDMANRESARVTRRDRQDEGEQRQAQSQMFAGAFQSRTGANNAQAARAGAMIQKLVADGMSAELAMQQTFANLMGGLISAQQATGRLAERVQNLAAQSGALGGQAAQMRTRGPSASPLVRRGM